METYLNEMIIDFNAKPQIPLSPAQIPFEQEFKAHLTNAVVNGGLEHQKVLNMTLIFCLLNKRGLSLDVIQENNALLCHLCMASDFSTSDSNIDNIINTITLAQGESV